MQNTPGDRTLDVMDPDLPLDVRQPKEGELALRRLLSELLAGPGDNAARRVEILTQIARAEALQGKLPRADASLLEAEKLLASVEALGPRLLVLLERGRLLVDAKTPMPARDRFIEVWTLAKDSEEDLSYAIDAANMMSKIETPKKRNEWTVRAIELADRSVDPRVRNWRGALYVSLGWHYLELLQLPRALEAFERAVAAFYEQGATLNMLLTRALVGRTMRMMHRLDEALELQQELLTELRRRGVDDPIVEEELAECLHALRRPGEAEAYFARAYGMLSLDTWLVGQDPSRMKRLRTLGKVKGSTP